MKDKKDEVIYNLKINSNLWWKFKEVALKERKTAKELLTDMIESYIKRKGKKNAK